MGCVSLESVVGRAVAQASSWARLLDSSRWASAWASRSLGLLLDGGDGVGAGDEAQRRLVLAGELDQGVGELGGVAALLAVHALPGGDGLLGALGVVVDRGLGVAAWTPA